MQNPLVTIICICYNQSTYITDALNSIWGLNYPNIQLIIADDASTDGSQQIIKELVGGREIPILFNSTNVGHCKIFNKALEFAKGEFVIDLSADDILLPNGLSKGISHFNEIEKSYDVLFADAHHIDDNGKIIGNHITSSFFYLGDVPEGDVYRDLLGKYFISPPTMIIRKSLLDKINGYDEELGYEDFDFWVRSSRISKYCYLPEITVKKRIHSDSMSSGQYIKNSEMLASTLKVCKTAFSLNKNKIEDFALIKRLAYESKMAIGSYNFSIAWLMFILLIKVFFKIRS
jgi:glycosyltransferase involved in cell wall biosynthesis